MKLLRSLLILALSMIFLLLGGCSGLMLRTEQPNEIHLRYWNEGNGTSSKADLFARQQDAVVSLISIGSFSSEGEFGTIVNVASGIIIDQEGYILSTEIATKPTYIDENGKIYTGTWTSVYAVLPEAYGTKNELYRLQTIDSNEELGFSLFSFCDNFYISENGAEEVEGFPIFAEFVLTAASGQTCYAVGNAIGNVINEVQFPYIAEYFYLSVTSGIVADIDDVDNSLLISAAVSPEMYGGAILDQNGYMIGMIFDKLQYIDDAENLTFAENAALGIGAQSLIRYLESVSSKLQIPIPYTVAITEVTE